MSLRIAAGVWLMLGLVVGFAALALTVVGTLTALSQKADAYVNPLMIPLLLVLFAASGTLVLGGVHCLQGTARDYRGKIAVSLALGLAFIVGSPRSSYEIVIGLLFLAAGLLAWASRRQYLHSHSTLVEDMSPDIRDLPNKAL